MGSYENETLIQVRLDATKKGSRLFRNSVGQTWIGKSFFISENKTFVLEKGDVIIKKARRITYGLQEGSSDLIGWTPCIITQDMVGKKVAIFTSIEIKTKKYKTVTQAQKNWIAKVQEDGGIAEIVKGE